MLGDSPQAQNAGIAPRAQPLRWMLRAYAGDQFLNFRQNALDNDVNPRRVGMHAVVLREAEIGGKKVRKENMIFTRYTSSVPCAA